ncbi:MAG TPA: helix-turn-helix domain-containing protein [Hyphomonadaceae bacterium]|nr:helix-turn-helix domain-containing protein [Hyphomonadaceae bacterium]HPN06214.1 helix-turn-helix domain-containing protein [Hyphomonadaceae bacterium]
MERTQLPSGKGQANKWDDLATDWCPVARAMSVIGDRWTLLIVRDCFLGKSKFDEFQKSLGVTRHVLSNRLKRLVDAGVLERNAYSERPVRYDYKLSDKGRDFAPALIGLKDWGKKHMPIRKPAAV